MKCFLVSMYYVKSTYKYILSPKCLLFLTLASRKMITQAWSELSRRVQAIESSEQIGQRQIRKRPSFKHVFPILDSMYIVLSLTLRHYQARVFPEAAAKFLSMSKFIERNKLIGTKLPKII